MKDKNPPKKKSISAVANLLAGNALGDFDIDIDDLCEKSGQAISESGNEKAKQYNFTQEVEDLLIKSSDNTSGTEMPFCFISCTEIAPWRFSDRPENEMGDIHDLAESIKLHGQQAPALVRKNGRKYELIFGNRRWRACSELGIDLLCKVVQTLDDKTAAALQTMENLDREDISDYARAMSFKRLIDDKIFQSEAQLSDKLRIPKTTLNNILAYTRLPDDILMKLPNINKISRKTIVKLSSLLKDTNNTIHLHKMLSQINSGEITSSNMDYVLYRNRSTKPGKKPDTDTVKNLEIKVKKYSNGSIKFVIDVPKKLNAQSIDEVKEKIKKVFA